MSSHSGVGGIACVTLTALALSWPGQAADKKAIGQAANDTVEITAIAYTNKDEIRQLLGEEMESGIVVLDVRVNPKGDKPLKVSRDDFMLRSDKDGQASGPFAPSQIAGNSVLVVSTTGGGGGIMADEGGPVWGGIGGPPRRMGGDGGVIGNSGGPGTTTATIHSGGKDKENPLLAVLKEKILPEKETAEPLSGLLYFPMEGKHKIKQLELIYRTPAGKLFLRFKQ
jgi:hypothetical protein